jgi:hypothetical protein
VVEVAVEWSVRDQSGWQRPWEEKRPGEVVKVSWTVLEELLVEVAVVELTVRVHCQLQCSQEWPAQAAWEVEPSLGWVQCQLQCSQEWPAQAAWEVEPSMG